MFATQKLCHYFLAHEVQLVIHDNLVRYLLQQLSLLGCVAQWFLKLIDFDIKCVTKRSIKGQALADILENHSPLP